MVKEKILFVIFLLSASAIDGENLILTKATCLLSISLLYLLEKFENYKKKGPYKTEPSVNYNSAYIIIAQGKEKVNGKMQSLRRKLRQWRTGWRCLSGMFGRRKAKTGTGRCGNEDDE